MEGWLLVDKPIGWTSFDVVNYLRRQIALETKQSPRRIRVGHSGNLDPFASGLLIILVGSQFTRQAAQLSKLDKVYELTAVLGYESATGDPESELIKKSNHRPSQGEIEQTINRFTGPSKQLPPIYSAIKIGGRPAYKLAREGKKVDLKPRPVNVFKLELIDYKYPVLRLKAEVSSGTYIRSLVVDIGQALGSGAYTKELRRTSIGPFSINQAIPVKELTGPNIGSHLKTELDIN